jgi:hypothetical protein
MQMLKTIVDFLPSVICKKAFQLFEAHSSIKYSLHLKQTKVNELIAVAASFCIFHLPCLCLYALVM